jgi:hypothetical protein
MKKLLGIIALGLLLSVGVGTVHAQTSATDQIADLLEQVRKLQDQIAELRGEIQEKIAIAAELKEGMTSEDVKLLQEMLAADPDVYPEGLITGFFGPLTKMAVMKFQEKHGLEAVGSVGPKTRAQLNGLLSDETFKCKAWGRLIAPGQLKKHGNVTIDVSNCANVPGGIAKKLGGDWKGATTTATSTSDTKAPVISDIDTDDIGTTTTEVSWRTNEKARGIVWYDTDDNVDLDASEMESVSTLKTTQSLTLENLSASTTYYFIVVATDKAGNSATSTVQNFETDDD